MSSLTHNQCIAKDLVVYHQAEGWLSNARNRPIQALYLTLKELGIESTIKIARFPCFVKSHNCEYLFSSGALEVEGILLNLEGSVGLDEIDAQLRADVALNLDLVWKGVIEWHPVKEIFYDRYERNYDSDPSHAQFQQVIDKGVARAHAYQLKTETGVLLPRPALSKVRL